MRKMTVGLALVLLALMALVYSATTAEARGGRTSAADCEAGSADPDCPDSAPQKKSASRELPATPEGVRPGSTVTT